MPTLQQLSSLAHTCLLHAVACGTLLAPPLTAMSWEEVEREARDTRGRIDSVYEIAQYGTVKQMTDYFFFTAYDPELRDGQGRRLVELAQLGGNEAMLRYLTSLDAALASEASRTQELVNQLGAQNNQGQLLEHAMGALRRGDTAALRAALSAGFQPNTFSTSDNAWPLEEAIKQGSLENVRLLIEAGASINVRSKREDFDKTMLITAARYDRSHIVRYLISQGADPMEQGSNEATALHDACYFNNLETVRVLLPYYKTINFSPFGGERHGYPINLVISHGFSTGVQIIQELQRLGFDPNHEMFAANPLLVTAAIMRRNDLLEPLLNAGADPEARDRHGRTAMDQANEQGKRILQQYQAKNERAERQTRRARIQRIRQLRASGASPSP